MQGAYSIVFLEVVMQKGVVALRNDIREEIQKCTHTVQGDSTLNLSNTSLSFECSFFFFFFLKNRTINQQKGTACIERSTQFMAWEDVEEQGRYSDS